MITYIARSDINNILNFKNWNLQEFTELKRDNTDEGKLELKLNTDFAKPIQKSKAPPLDSVFQAPNVKSETKGKTKNEKKTVLSELAATMAESEARKEKSNRFWDRSPLPDVYTYSGRNQEMQRKRS